ncbi:MAG: hypothetical protein PSX81_09885 [bacterium]|nr:hypothetical protein [bacterium]
MKKIIILLITVFPLVVAGRTNDSIKVVGDTFLSCTTIVYDKAEQMPFYNLGGFQSLCLSINQSLKKDKLANGDLMLNFIINCKGQICQIEIQNSFNVLFDQRLILEFLRLQNWLPGKQNGTPIDCKLSASLSIKNGKIKI